MYYIYHIPNVKIGVSEEPDNRVKKQGYTDYEILEKHSCIYKVSKREQELQKEYGYPIDTSPYHVSRKYWGKVAGKSSPFVTDKDYHRKMYKKSNESNKKNNSKVILQFDMNGNFIKEWVGIKETARHFRPSYTNLSDCLRGNQKSYAGFIWKYKEKNLDN